MALKYHQAFFDLLGKKPQVSKRAVEAIKKRERALNFKMPASLREFYSLTGACEILYEHSNEDSVVPVEQLGDAEALAHGHLLIQVENQDVARWYVRLDGSEDPPVEVESEAHRRKPPKGADDWGYRDVASLHPLRVRFSEFVYERALYYGGGTQDRETAKRLEALGAHVGFDDEGNAIEAILDARVFGPSRKVKKLPFDAKLAMGLVRKLERLRSLSIRMAKITPGAWAALRDHPGIRELDDSGSLEDAAVQYVVTMPALRKLGVGNQELTDAGLARLLTEHQFESVGIDMSATLSARGLAALANQKKLKRFSISDYDRQLTDDALDALAGVTSLQELELNSVRMGDRGLKFLAKLTCLRTLWLYLDKMTDAGLVHLAGLTALTELRILRNERITGAGFRHLKGLKALRTLELRELPIADASLVHLSPMKNLEELDLRGTKVIGPGFKALINLPRLKKLDCGGNGVVKSAIPHLARMPALQELDLSHAKLKDEDLLGLKTLRTLKELDLKAVPLSEATIRALKAANPKLSVVA